MLKNLALLNLASGRMNYDSKRHNMLASNIAHADTPGYVGKDLAPFKIDDLPLSLQATRSTHLNFSQNDNPYSALQENIRQAAFDETLNKNGVSIEEEMAKASQAQASYDLSSTIWRKSIGLFMSVVNPRA